MPGGQERSENDFTSHQGSKRYPEMKLPSDLPETGDYPGHPVCGGSSLLAAWGVFGGFTSVPRFLCFCAEFPRRTGYDSIIEPHFSSTSSRGADRSGSELEAKGQQRASQPQSSHLGEARVA